MGNSCTNPPAIVPVNKIPEIIGGTVQGTLLHTTGIKPILVKNTAI